MEANMQSWFKKSICLDSFVSNSNSTSLCGDFSTVSVITRHRAAWRAAIVYGVESTHGAVARNEVEGPQGKRDNVRRMLVVRH
jgi:hypothetical protein